MKITVYTITDCQFSKQEKEYLNANKLVFEEKNLEVNKDFLTEMLAVSNNFAGTPVTRVEKDDGSIAVLKGFTKEEFDTTFGFTPTPADSSQSPVTSPTSSGQLNDTPITIPPVTQPIPPTPIEPTSVPLSANDQVVPTPTDLTEPAVTADPLKSVMDDLQSKSQPATPTPSIPDFPKTTT